MRITDLERLLLKYRPQIVHFAGHGFAANEVILENSTGNSVGVPYEAFNRLFALLQPPVKCVVLNACYSEEQARGIAANVDCVIGMSNAIGDETAIAFASALFGALAYGESVQSAFDLASLQIDLQSLNQGDTPRLLVKGNSSTTTFASATQQTETITQSQEVGSRRRWLNIALGSRIGTGILGLIFVASALALGVILSRYASAEPIPTPTFVPASPVPTQASVPTLSVPVQCPTPADFTDVWLDYQHELRCSEANSIATDVTYQEFQNGIMVWLKETDRIYVLPLEKTWTWHPNDWDPSQPEFSCPEAKASDGARMGFGKAWCEPSVRAEIGDPTSEELPTPDMEMQNFEGGLIFDINDEDTIVLFDSGSWVKR